MNTGAEIAAAYDAIAAEYDRQVEASAWMRRALWNTYANTFHAGEHILDVSCGTGADAIFLARQGLSVTAVDISPEMIARLEAKVSCLGLAEQVRVQVGDLARLERLSTGPFDGAISVFAALSMQPDLAPFAAGAARALKPGGRLVVHMLNRRRLWALPGQACRGDWSAALHPGRQEVCSFMIGSRPVLHYLYYPLEAYRRFFIAQFHLRRAWGQGVLLPVGASRYLPPRLLEWLGRLERSLMARPPLLNWGDFFVLEMEKRDEVHR